MDFWKHQLQLHTTLYMCKQAWGYDTSKSGTETRDRGYLPGSHIFAVISPLPPNVQGFRLLPEGIWVE
jgi:hypothetical protein